MSISDWSSDVCSSDIVNPALQLRPEAFKGIDAAALFRAVLPAIVVHFQVAVALLVDVLVAAHFVIADRRAGTQLTMNKIEKSSCREREISTGISLWPPVH